MTERSSIWLLIVLPVIVALLLLVPLGCVTGIGSCVEDEPCPPPQTTCYSLAGLPASSLSAVVGVTLVGGAGTAAYLRWLRAMVVSNPRTTLWCLAVLAALTVGACGPAAGPALWWPAQGEVITPQTQSLDVLIMEVACANGEPAVGRVKDPEIQRDQEKVVVTFHVTPLREANCPGNPPTPHHLDLGEPLGDRRLLDGGNVALCDEREWARRKGDCDVRKPVPADP